MFLVYLSSLQNPPNPIPYLTDKMYHVLLYMGFGIVLRLALSFTSKPTLITLTVGTAFGISDEFHQMFVPNRTASVYDLLADVMGLVLSQILIYIWVRFA